MRLEVAMRSALSLANHGIGSCYPNPSVGCVILDKSNNLIGVIILISLIIGKIF